MNNVNKDLQHLQTEFLRIQKELTAFIFRLTCHREDAEDIVQDTFISASKHWEGFRYEASVKTWLYTIAINKAKNSLKVQKRWAVDAQDQGEALHLGSQPLLDNLYGALHTEPDLDFEIKEHIQFCFTCITKTLDLPQQICIWLKEFYGFTLKEIETITGLTEGGVKHSLAYGKKHLNEVFEKRCAFINKQGVCHQCTSLKGFFNPKQDALAKANEIKMQKQTENETLLDVRIRLINSINPLESANSHLHTYMLENMPAWTEQKNEK